MWPFRNKHIDNNTLIAIRYTKGVFKELFPTMSDDDWEKMNCPHDINKFVKSALVSNAKSYQKPAKAILVATIDSYYLSWLERNKLKHSQRSIYKYLQNYSDDMLFWDERLRESEMNDAYNILGVPCMLMPNDCSEQKTYYSLGTNAAEEVTRVLKGVCRSDRVFVPGWILKGDVMRQCGNDIIHLADVYWEKGTRVRFGKFLEQQYSKVELEDKFTPIYCVVPFVVRTQRLRSIIDLSGTATNVCPTLEHEIAALEFSEHQRLLLLKSIANDVPQIISLGINSVSSKAAYLSYMEITCRRERRASGLFKY